MAEKRFLTRKEALAKGIPLDAKPKPPKKIKSKSKIASIREKREKKQKGIIESPHLYLPKDHQLALIKLNNLLGDLFLKWTPHQFQIDMINAIVVDGHKVLACETGRQIGKCFAKDTQVLMSDLSVKAVQDVQVGDKVMGPDSKPRLVTSLGRGREMMYQVKPRSNYGGDYTVNASHLLALKERKRDGSLQDKIISVTDYLNEPLNKTKNRYMGYRAPLDFPESKLKIDPYFLGLWLGDGNTRDLQIHSVESEIVDWMRSYSKTIPGCSLVKYQSEGGNPSHAISSGMAGGRGRKKNNLLTQFRNYDLIQNKHIPTDFLKTSRENRLKLLAGIIDTDGHKPTCKGGASTCEITFKNKRLVDDTCFLARSLGLRVSVTEKIATLKSRNYSCLVYRIHIYGDMSEVPTLLPRKQYEKRTLRENPLTYGFDIVEKEEGDYYGFTVDKDHLFLLADLSVVHNTEGIIALSGLWSQLVPGSQSYFLAPFLNQARRILWDSGRIAEILPDNWIDDMKEKNSTVYFAGSRHCFLTIDGADKFDKSRGISVKKGIVFLDECRDMKEDVWPTIEPALGVHDCPVVMTSTPPEDLYPYPTEPKRLHWFCRVVDDAKAAPNQTALFAKTADNPHFPKHIIEQKRQEYTDRGKDYVFLREYDGARVEGKASREWPMLAHESRFVFQYEDLLKEIYRDISKMHWYCMTDPAGASVWAWLFVGVNPYSKTIYVMDEIYETKKENMALSLIWPKAKEYMNQIFEYSNWHKHYDEAETWFQNEIYQNYQENFNPSYKTSKSKEEGFRLLSDIFLAQKIKFSHRAVSTYWELKNYEGNKSADHSVDNLRYFLNVSNYALPEKEYIDNSNMSPAEQRFHKVTGQLRQNDDVVDNDWQDKLLSIH